VKFTTDSEVTLSGVTHPVAFYVADGGLARVSGMEADPNSVARPLEPAVRGHH
jgi:hypothetical protein